jgi:hypothetical protein
MVFGARSAGNEENLALLARNLVHRERDAGVGNVEDHVHPVDVVPLACDLRADVGLVLMVGRHDLDLHALLGRAEVLDRHARRDDRARAADRRIQARHVRQHADLDDASRDLRVRAGCRECGGQRERRRGEQAAFELHGALFSFG